MYREIITDNTTILVNNKEYSIEKLVGKGGCSLVYLASEKKNSLHSWIIKEFFPQNQIAYRKQRETEADYGVVCSSEGQESAFFNLKNRFFHQEALLGNVLKEESFPVYSFDSIDEENGFAVMRPFSKDTVSLLELVKLWETNPPVSQDPYYSAMGRVSYALHIAEALLVLIEKMHKEGILHLDLSYNNVAWAGLDREARGVHSNVFLLDFGCAVKLNDGRHYKENPLDYSCSVGFSAPEVSDPMINELDCRADLYSVSALLFFLCTGKDAVTNLQWKMMDRLWQNSKWIRNGVKKLDIPAEIKEALCDILIKGCAKEPADRYCNAGAMLEKIHGLKVLAENYQSKHLLCRPVRPISQGFIPRTRELMEEIDTSLRNHKICVLCGMSGVGKSETARQYAQYSTSLTYEILLPEMITGQHYDWEKEIEKLRISGDGDSVDRGVLLREFLNRKSALLILHNFNTVDTYLLQELMDTNASVIITSQCAAHEFEVCNDFPVSACLDLSNPSREFLRKVFLTQFKTGRESAAEQMKAVDTIIEGLFFNTMLIHTTALQLAEYPNRNAIADLADELSCSISLADTYMDTPGVIYEKDYASPFEDEEEKDPFEIAMAVVVKVLPKLSNLQKQVLQFLAVFQGEWLSMEDVSLYLGDDINSRRRKISPEIRKLQRKHLIETQFVEDQEEILLHPMMQQVMFRVSVEGLPYIELPSVEFFTYVERNMFLSKFDMGKRRRLEEEFPVLGNHFGWKERTRLAWMKEWCLINHIFDESELIDLTEEDIDSFIDSKKSGIVSDGELAEAIIGRENFFCSRYVELAVPNDIVQYREVHIYNDYGVMYLKACGFPSERQGDFGREYRQNFLFEMDTSQRLKSRYYEGADTIYMSDIDISEGKFVNTSGYSCSVSIYINGKDQEGPIMMPSLFAGIPIHHIDLHESGFREYDMGLDDDELAHLIVPYRRRPSCEIVLADTCKVFSGWAKHMIKLTINERLEELNLYEHSLTELMIPENVAVITDQTISPEINQIKVSSKNPNFIEQDGLIYTRDKKKLLFLPPERRCLSVSVSSQLEKVNQILFGYRRDEFSIFNLPIAVIEWIEKRADKISKLEECLYIGTSYKDFNEFINTGRKILEFYNSYIENSKVSFFVKYLHCYSSICPIDDMDSDTIHFSSVEETIANTERWMLMGLRDLKERENVEELTELIDPINFQKIYEQFLEEGVYEVSSLMTLRTNLFTIDYPVIKQAIDIFKESHSCKSLQYMVSISSLKGVAEELLDICVNLYQNQS